MFGKPALVSRLVTGDTQCVALLAEQRIAPVARADAHYRQLVREMHDEASFRIKVAGRVQALDEFAFALDSFESGRSHACHQPHVDGHVGAVGNFDATAGVRRIDWTHAVRDHIHRAPAHRAFEQGVHLRARLGRVHPVVIRTSVLLLSRANESEMLDARDIAGIREVQIAVRIGLRV